MFNNSTNKLSVYSSIYTDPVIGEHLSPKRDRCPGSLMVRAGVADALANGCFNPLYPVAKTSTTSDSMSWVTRPPLITAQRITPPRTGAGMKIG
jgi:hypothetical protein